MDGAGGSLTAAGRLRQEVELGRTKQRYGFLGVVIAFTSGGAWLGRQRCSPARHQERPRRSAWSASANTGWWLAISEIGGGQGDLWWW